ncbi:Two-component response regulator ARR17 [Linum perenne]
MDGRAGVVAGGNSGGCSGNSMELAIHVLAVDDNLVERKLLERLLKNVSSCTVTTAENGVKALEYLGLQDEARDRGLKKVNLIITDYCMPGMTGYELLKKIKVLEGRSRDVHGEAAETVGCQQAHHGPSFDDQ